MLHISDLPGEKLTVADDGREIWSVATGPADGFPVIWHHGNPGSRVPPCSELVAAELGLRLISYDRPGCGKSTPLPGHIVADLAPDVARIADSWGVPRFATAGISGGGAFALATAALLPDRCTAAALLSTSAPIDAHGLEFDSGMTETNAQAAAEAAEPVDRAATLASGEPMRQELLRDPLACLMGFAQEFPEADRAALEDPAIRDPVVAGMAECVRCSGEGWLDASNAFGSPWGFDVRTVSRPVGVWQGVDDSATPIGHARWLASHVPGAELHELAGGHYAPLFHLAEISDWLRSNGGR
ncbi:MAG TPA: alpha/beta hydrolase [Gaiellaceae bacterium]|jgi:pimeloyl-ACP methyl ester carboxylesterase|nr:alpha/beta hydrolase [Gaiellaceae bacterium]